ncbi:glycoside hydrolase family 76 protein [Corynebacterium sp. Marseille-P3884]|uniref:glycoside hydrolase family 76 protein n=1 Tax=Corynebacterium sp. Marseille-P3884 TaxID=2495409 RepID=UPI001B33E7D6|nr:glycoside hydrolase family 76 [Corynebacterium sp. Marseille-P3884]
MPETWAHRADLAEMAITERHATKLWGLPRTNLAVVSWPPTTKEKVFFHWHYWWQAHYLDCLVDAESRRSTKARRAAIVRTIRGIRLRNLGKLIKNRYYDDKAWLALALNRVTQSDKVARPKQLDDLEFNILAGLDSVLGVLPWRTDENFFNVPANGPAAIMLARTGRMDKARALIDWIFDHLMSDDGLVEDGMRLLADGPRNTPTIYTYNQGTVLGAALEIALGLEDKPEEQVYYITHIRSLVQAISMHVATPGGVIDNPVDGDGDGGLFKGILVRYLAEVAVRLPEDSPASISAKRAAERLVMASAESMWNHRLEVDGLPIFPARWTRDAKLPHNYSLGPSSISDALGTARISERDLSVQLSGWMLLEAAARVSKARKEREGE